VWLCVEMTECVDVSMVKEGVDPGAFHGEEPGDMFVFFWSCQVDFFMGGVDVAADDDVVFFCFEVVSVAEELVVEVEFVLESWGVFFLVWGVGV